MAEDKKDHTETATLMIRQYVIPWTDARSWRGNGCRGRSTWGTRRVAWEGQCHLSKPCEKWWVDMQCMICGREVREILFVLCLRLLLMLPSCLSSSFSTLFMNSAVKRPGIKYLETFTSYEVALFPRKLQWNWTTRQTTFDAYGAFTPEQDNDKTTTRQKLNLCISIMSFTPGLSDLVWKA